MFNTLIFDFDGVIIDTETPEYVTWQEIFRSYDVYLEMSLWTQFIGGGSGTFNVYQHLEEISGRSIDHDIVRNEMRPRYLERIDENPLLPGVLEYIQTAKNLGLNLAIASSSSRNWVEGHLAKRELLHHFDLIRTKDDVANVKPDPELYLTSASTLGIQPQHSIVIEDSANGVTAAKRAGMFCVAVPNPMTKGLSLESADLRLESLSEMPLETLISEANKGL